MNTEDYKKLFLPLVDYLKEIGCGEQQHGKGDRSLLHHLVGVSKLLSERGSSDALCVAGLFHSVYGTSWFKHKMVPMEERDKIRELIGEWPEKIVYEFCILPKDRRAGITALPDSQLKNDIIDLAYANHDETRIWKEENNASDS